MEDSLRVGLGFLRLDIAEEGPPAGPSDWIELSTAHLQPSDRFKNPVLAEALIFLLQDEGVVLNAAYRLIDGSLVVRPSVVPSDATSSTWARCDNKKYRAARERSLATVFAHLRREETGTDFVLNTEGIVGMTDLYASLPSPPEVSLGERYWTGDHEVYSRLEGADDPRGLKTRLYRYQFRSVGKMLKMETTPGTLIDPTLVPLLAADGASTYYLDNRNWTVQRSAPFYTLPRGGILCEQMGTGKTLMCLSLILSTLHQPCMPPAGALDCSEAITYHALHTWPFERYRTLRQSANIDEDEVLLVRPTLLSLCTDLLARNDPTAVVASGVRAAVNLDRRCVYLETPPEPPLMRRARKRYADPPARQVWLANTTIVVVPAILVQQWREEIDKHIEPGALQTLIIGRKDPMPTTQKLMQHDIVMMSLERFSKEGKAESSPLEGARWKRIILDEGHVAGTRLSNAMVLARRLSVERRWLVSGTPTKHLQQGGESQDSRTEADYWTKRDSDDITRIGNMISGFLEGRISQGYATFQDVIVKPLMRRSPGALERLKYLMSSLMVKHAPGVIDTETTLPPTSVSTVMLDLHPMQRITYNVLAALVASNVYTSNFEDRDYFLHPSNTESFNQVVRNLHLACFWYTSPHMGAEESLERTRSMLEDSRKITPDHRLKLEEACQHLQRALDTKGWSEWMTNGHSVAYDARNLPALIQTAWSDSMDTDPEVIDAVSLHLLAENNRRGRDIQQLHIAGWDARIGKCQEALEQQRKDEKRFSGSSGSKPHKGAKKQSKSTAKGSVQGTKTAASAPSEIKKARYSPRKGKASQVTEVDQQIAAAARNARLQAAAARGDKRSRPLPDSFPTCSRSSKINFVVGTLLDAVASDKFVIFGNGAELGHLNESLVLFDIPSCSLGSSLRPEALEEFRSADKRVCLLDIRLAARGLNLVMANRMIILSPIWNPDVQAQAIKRIHRIGQTRPTEVQILVTKGTFEEDIAFRATTKRTQDEEKLYSRAMIENPRFVYDERLPDRHFQISLLPAAEAKKEAELAQYRKEQQAIVEAAVQSSRAEERTDQLESPFDDAILTPATVRTWGSATHTLGDEPELPLRNKRARFDDALPDHPSSSTAPRRMLRWAKGADSAGEDLDGTTMEEDSVDEDSGSVVTLQVGEKSRLAGLPHASVDVKPCSLRA